MTRLHKKLEICKRNVERFQQFTDIILKPQEMLKLDNLVITNTGETVIHIGKNERRVLV